MISKWGTFERRSREDRGAEEWGVGTGVPQWGGVWAKGHCAAAHIGAVSDLFALFLSKSRCCVVSVCLSVCLCVLVTLIKSQ